MYQMFVSVMSDPHSNQYPSLHTESGPRPCTHTHMHTLRTQSQTQWEMVALMFKCSVERREEWMNEWMNEYFIVVAWAGKLLKWDYLWLLTHYKHSLTAFEAYTRVIYGGMRAAGLFNRKMSSAEGCHCSTHGSSIYSLSFFSFYLFYLWLLTVCQSTL